MSYAHLSRKPLLFRSFTGLAVSEFDVIAKEIESKYDEHERKRLSNRKRKRDIGGVDPSHIWPDLRSILAVPILDNNNVPLGTLCVDSDHRYTDAGFDDPRINNLLILLSRGVGRLLEGYSI